MPLHHLIWLLILTLLTGGCAAIPGQTPDSMLLPPTQDDVKFQAQHEDDRSGSSPVEPNANGDYQEAATSLLERPMDADHAEADVDGLANTARGEVRDHEPSEPYTTDRQGQALLDEALDFCEVAQDFWQKGELENALEALDKAYSLILQVETSDDDVLMQQKEDLRFSISKRILEIYASRNVAVNGHHNAIPLVLNHHVQAEIDRFTKGPEKKAFLAAYERSGSYRPYILQALKEAGLPKELSWVPLIESGFKVQALSKARALGLWQFIASTGYKYGLKRDRYIDERLDPIKSTQAAIAYLRALHNIFGDWATVLAAYNCGEGCVLRLIRSQNINYLDNFWDLYERLPRETARHVPRFWATLHIVSAPEKYGLAKIKMDPPLAFETVEINRQVHLKDVAVKTGIPFKTLKELNPELRYSILPQEQYVLRIPPGKSQVVLAKLDEIPTSSLTRRDYVWHQVGRGETMSTIARRYRTTVGSIMQANNLSRPNYIVAGKKLRIPQEGTVVSQAARSNHQVYLAGGIHLVKRGDSLWIVAKRYGTTTQKIQELNDLPTTRLHIGQRLKIPGHDTGTSDRVKFTTYRVKQGDSPYTIAQRHKMSLVQLLLINGLTPGSTIYPGQKLAVE